VELKALEGRRVLVTGHTGFKGSWLSLWLHDLGAKVSGFALPPEKPSLFSALKLDALIDSRLGDVRDAAAFGKALRQAKPEIVFHLAAQPLVLRSYEDPVETFSANVMGLVNLLDAARKVPSVKVLQIITTDKCYENDETGRAYAEGDPLGGRDPYSASKACAELVAASYRDSFYSSGASLATARAGNVIGGGDWAKDRILPDCARALKAKRPVVVRNPESVRPWQHVLEPLSGYLALACRQLEQPRRFSQAWNFGPDESDSVTVGALVESAVKHWGSGRWIQAPSDDGGGREARVLRLDCAKARRELGWSPRWSVEDAVRETMLWYKAAAAPRFDAPAFCRAQLADYAESKARA
jgi:CDP-glucose 4,6-dehydratase